MARRSPKQFYAILFALLVSAGAFAAASLLKIKLIYAWLISINLLSFLAYGFDKYQAVRQNSRIPEIILHLLALLGGSPSALAAQFIFRHKINKTSFMVVFILVMILQLITAGIFFYYTRSKGLS